MEVFPLLCSPEFVTACNDLPCCCKSLSHVRLQKALYLPDSLYFVLSHVFKMTFLILCTQFLAPRWVSFPVLLSFWSFSRTEFIHKPVGTHFVSLFSELVHSPLYFLLLSPQSLRCICGHSRLALQSWCLSFLGFASFEKNDVWCVLTVSSGAYVLKPCRYCPDSCLAHWTRHLPMQFVLFSDMFVLHSDLQPLLLTFFDLPNLINQYFSSVGLALEEMYITVDIIPAILNVVLWLIAWTIML